MEGIMAEKVIGNACGSSYCELCKRNPVKKLA
jgi:hypothetical protein